ncbi:MAG: zf-HC2 domain-containing protein [Longimicrobiales bacterium]
MMPSPIDCRTAVERLWEYLDHELPDGPLEELEAHLRACAECPPHFAFAAKLLRDIRSARAGESNTEVLRTRVLAALRAEGFMSVHL